MSRLTVQHSPLVVILFAVLAPCAQALAQVTEIERTPSAAHQASVPNTNQLMTSVRVTVAIVGDNLVIRPVPLHELRLTPLAHGGQDLITARTGLDGTTTLAIPWGIYEVTSAQPVTVDGTQYFWMVELDAKGSELRLELTNANARTAATAPGPPRTRQMAPEMEVYRTVRAGVFRIEAGLQNGSGFLVDSSGTVLTNAHVVAGVTSAVAVLDSITRVRAQILYRENDADIAVLRIAPSHAIKRPVLPLSQASPLVEPGERVFAVGYPLHQEQTVTSGIVSSLRAGAVISDVNINHGNSGGPLLNLAGEVVAINTFGDFTDQGGPGVSGSVVITRAFQPLEVAKAHSDTAGPPADVALRPFPSGRFRIQDLKALADSANITDYRKFSSIGVGRFSLSVATPAINYVTQKAFESEIGKDRKKREKQAGIGEEERFSEMRNIRDWMEYIGDDRAPVVAITVEPKIGETTGSVFRRLMLTGAAGKATLRYSGDLQGASFFRNGEIATPLKGGTTPVKQYVNNHWIDLKDVANYGFFVLPAEVFAPDADGAPPSIVIELADFKNPTLEACRELSREVVARIWNDFGVYFAAAGLQFVRADPSNVAVGLPEKDKVCSDSRQARGAPPVERPESGTRAMGGRP